MTFSSAARMHEAVALTIASRSSSLCVFFNKADSKSVPALSALAITPHSLLRLEEIALGISVSKCTLRSGIPGRPSAFDSPQPTMINSPSPTAPCRIFLISCSVTLLFQPQFGEAPIGFYVTAPETAATFFSSFTKLQPPCCWEWITPGIDARYETNKLDTARLAGHLEFGFQRVRALNRRV